MFVTTQMLCRVKSIHTVSCFRSVDELPVNFALLQLVGVAVPDDQPDAEADLADHFQHYTASKRCIEELAIFLKPLPQGKTGKG